MIIEKRSDRWPLEMSDEREGERDSKKTKTALPDEAAPGVKIHAVMMEGELLAAVEVPPSTTVRELKEAIAATADERHKACWRDLKLMLKERELEDGKSLAAEGIEGGDKVVSLTAVVDSTPVIVLLGGRGEHNQCKVTQMWHVFKI